MKFLENVIDSKVITLESYQNFIHGMNLISINEDLHTLSSHDIFS